MQKTKAVQIGTRSFTLKELNVRAVRDLMNNEQGSEQNTGFADRFQSLLVMACPELTHEVLLDLYPSEIEELWQAFEEVNSAFLGVIRKIGLDQALIGAVTEAVKGSIGQFASLSNSATVPAFGTMATASS